MSTVGILQGSVISPILCNLYKSNSMEGFESKQAEFADDASILKANENVYETIKDLNRDLEVSGQKVEIVCQKKLLVVIIDEDLKFEQHVRAFSENRPLTDS